MMKNKKIVYTFFTTISFILLFTIAFIGYFVLNINKINIVTENKGIEELYSDSAKETGITKIASLNNLGESFTFLAVHPVGTIYITTTQQNPGEIYGGTWVAYSQGRTLVGYGSASDGTTSVLYNTIGATGGNYSISLTSSNLPAHTHTITINGSVSSSFSGSTVTSTENGWHQHTVTTSGSVSSSFSGYGSWTSTDGAHSHSISKNVDFTVYYGEGSGVSGIYGNNSGWGGYYPAHWYTVWINTAGDHTHSITPSGSVSSSFSGSYSNTTTNGAHTHSFTPYGTVSSSFTGTPGTTSSVGNNTAFNIQNPYVAVYMWQRTA